MKGRGAARVLVGVLFLIWGLIITSLFRFINDHGGGMSGQHLIWLLVIFLLLLAAPFPSSLDYLKDRPNRAAKISRAVLIILLAVITLAGIYLIAHVSPSCLNSTDPYACWG